jgi:predicted RNA-binding Zn ribbon-like protein
MRASLAAPWPGIGVGGSLALDFVNTLDWRLREEPVELLRSYADLLRWARSAGVLDAREARTLSAWGEDHPRAAAQALAAAIRIREETAAIFQEISQGKGAPEGPLARLAEACREESAGRTLRARGRTVDWTWGAGPATPARPAWAAALDAARLLTAPDRDRVRQCADAQCGWFFVDVSRNRSRRWCTMRGCGNRNKARSFYRRRKRPEA